MKEKKNKKKKKLKEYDPFFMQYGFKEDRRIRNRSTFTESKFWEKYVKDNKPEGLLEGLVDLLANNAGIVNKYVDAYEGWSAVVNELADPETDRKSVV